MNTSYWPKNMICPTCKSDNVGLIFFKQHNISDIIKAAEQGKITLVSSKKENEELAWLCKNCYDVGEIVIR